MDMSVRARTRHHAPWATAAPSVQVSTIGTDPDPPTAIKRIIAGTFFSSPRAQLGVSEFDVLFLGSYRRAEMRRLSARCGWSSAGTASRSVFNMWLFKVARQRSTLQTQTRVDKIKNSCPPP